MTYRWIRHSRYSPRTIRSALADRARRRALLSVPNAAGNSEFFGTFGTDKTNTTGHSFFHGDTLCPKTLCPTGSVSVSVQCTAPRNSEFSRPDLTDARFVGFTDWDNSYQAEIAGRLANDIVRTAALQNWPKNLFELARRCTPHVSTGKHRPESFRLTVARWMITNGTARAFATVWSEFLGGLARVRVPAGRGVKDSVAGRVGNAGFWPGEYPDPERDSLLCACRELAAVAEGTAALRAQNPHAVFYLSSRVAAELTSMSRMTAARRIKDLIADGWIAEAEKCTTHRATRYRLLKPVHSPQGVCKCPRPECVDLERRLRRPRSN